MDRLRKAVADDAGSLSFVALAHVLLERGEPDEAIRICEEGLQRHPNHSTGHLILGLALEGADREEDAVRSLQEVLNLDPGNRIAVKRLGEAYRRRNKKSPPGKKKESEFPPEEGEEAVEVDLGQEIAFFTFSMAEVYEKQGFFEKALAIYRRVLTIQPGRDEVRDRIQELKRKMSAA
ncbi:MAG: tetratricopeptide repeat protein [Candidatus Eisenbacteria bacterium]